MSFSGWLFAAMYDRMLAGVEKAGLRERRAGLLEAARGRVLEIGAGTGANLALYGSNIEALTVTEPEAPMARRLAKHLPDCSRPVDLVEASAEQLPMPDGEFDTVVSTLVLCTVPDPLRALCEVWRVLKPGGQFLFIEHVRSQEPKLAKWQDRLNGINKVIAHGCNCNRSTLEMIERAGFTLRSLEKGRLAKAPAFVSPLITGVAVKAASSVPE
jgi:ubiquinone/menaquinone biosynthesis C-methylase UbiE